MAQWLKYLLRNYEALSSYLQQKSLGWPCALVIPALGGEDKQILGAS